MAITEQLCIGALENGNGLNLKLDSIFDCLDEIEQGALESIGILALITATDLENTELGLALMAVNRKLNTIVHANAVIRRKDGQKRDALALLKSVAPAAKVRKAA